MKAASIFASGAASQLQKGFGRYKEGDNAAAIFHFTRAARLLKGELAQGIKTKGQPGCMSVEKYIEKSSELRLAYSFRANAYSRMGNQTRKEISQKLADRLVD
jgi:hypothetical protein